MLKSNVVNGDLGFWWRCQTPRSMDQLDELIQYKLSIAKQLDAEKVQEIEADVNLFADADQFRIYHAVGRFRGTICAVATTALATTFLNGGQNGRQFMRK